MSVTIKNRLTISGTPEQVKEIFDRYNSHCPAKLRIKDGLAFCKTIDDENIDGSREIENIVEQISFEIDEWDIYSSY